MATDAHLIGPLDYARPATGYGTDALAPQARFVLGRPSMFVQHRIVATDRGVRVAAWPVSAPRLSLLVAALAIFFAGWVSLVQWIAPADGRIAGVSFGIAFGTTTTIGIAIVGLWARERACRARDRLDFDRDAGRVSLPEQGHEVPIDVVAAVEFLDCGYPSAGENEIRLLLVDGTRLGIVRATTREFAEVLAGELCLPLVEVRARRGESIRVIARA